MTNRDGFDILPPILDVADEEFEQLCHESDRLNSIPTETLSNEGNTNNNDNKETQEVNHTATATATSTATDTSTATAASASRSATKPPSTETTRSCTESSAASTSLSLSQNANYKEYCSTIRRVVIGKLHPVKDKVKIKSLRNKSRSIKFPVKLMYTLEECRELHKDCLVWTDDGKSFAIMNPEVFEKEVLPENFKDAKFQSFLRKLYRWGFVKKPDASNVYSYTYVHPNFRRGNYSLCMDMSCADNPSSAKPSKKQNTFPTLPSRPQSTIHSTSSGYSDIAIEPTSIAEILNRRQFENQNQMQMQMMTCQQTSGLSREATIPIASTSSSQNELMQQLAHNDFVIKQGLAKLQRLAQVQQLNANALNSTNNLQLAHNNLVIKEELVELQQQAQVQHLNANELNPTNNLQLAHNNFAIEQNLVELQQQAQMQQLNANELNPTNNLHSTNINNWYHQKSMHGQVLPAQGAVNPQQGITPLNNATLPQSNDNYMLNTQQGIAPLDNATMPYSNDNYMNNSRLLRLNDFSLTQRINGLSMAQRNPPGDLNELQRSQGDSLTPPHGLPKNTDVSARRRGGNY